MFCVRCGREVGEAPLVGGLCEACYLEENVLASIPQHVDFERCVHCGARRRGELWVELGEPVEVAVAEAVREAVVLDRRVREATVDVRLEPQDERNFAAEARVQGVAEAFPFDATVSTKARVKNSTCLRCSRIMGGYYEGLIQLRATRRDLGGEEKRRARALCSRIIERIVAEGDRFAFVLRDEEMHGGLDVYVGTTNAGRVMAKALVAEFGGKLTESAKIAGQRDGLDLYRVTFLVRIPEFSVGDAVVVREEVRLVQSIGPKNVTLRDPVSGRVETVDRGVVDKAAVLPRAGAREAVVVSAQDSELQVLDPWTLQTVSVLRPAGVEGAPETVPVLRWEEDLVVLPPA